MDVLASGVTGIVGPSFRIAPSDVAFHLSSYRNAPITSERCFGFCVKGRGHFCT